MSDSTLKKAQERFNELLKQEIQRTISHTQMDLTKRLTGHLREQRDAGASEEFLAGIKSARSVIFGYGADLYG